MLMEREISVRADRARCYSTFRRRGLFECLLLLLVGEPARSQSGRKILRHTDCTVIVRCHTSNSSLVPSMQQSAAFGSVIS